MEYQRIKTKTDGRVGIITICYPPYNTFTKRMIVEILDALDVYEKDDYIRCVLLNSEGPDFSQGADLDDIADEAAGEGEFTETFSQLGGKLVERVDSYPKATCVVGRGTCFGGSSAVFSAFDIRIVGESFNLHDGDIYYGTVGSWGMSSLRLPLWIGRNRMLDYMFLNENFTGRELKELGLVSKVYPDEYVEEIGLATAKKMATAGPIAVRVYKECVRRATNPNYEELRKMEEEASEYIYTTNDCKRGLASLKVGEEYEMYEFQGD